MLIAMRAVTYVAAILAALILVVGVGGASGAPQEAAAAALAAAVAIIPYCISATLHRARLVKLAEHSAGVVGE